MLASFGFITDIHYADRDKVDNDFVYRDALPKVEAAVTKWNTRNLDFVLMCGDFIDHLSRSYPGTESEGLADLPVIDAVFQQANAPAKYVLGNHDVDVLTKAQFIANTGMDDPYYSFDVQGKLHVIVLDTCFYADDNSANFANGNWESYSVRYVPPAQRTWLTNDLASTSLPTIVFSHYGLAGTRTNHVTNAAAVRSILEASGKVIACFNGHDHVNERSVVNGIPYLDLNAATRNDFPANAYAIVTIRTNGSIVVEGFGSQASYS